MASAASSLVVGRLTRLPDGWSDLVEPAAALGHDLVPLPMAKGAPWMAARRGTEFNSWTSIIDPLTDDHRALQLPAHPVYMTRCAPDRSDPLIARSWTIGLASRGDRPKTYVGLRGTRFAAQVFDTMVPTPDHRVRLDDGPVDALGQRRLRIRITYDQQVRRTMIGARDRLREVFAGAEYHLRPLVDVDPTLRPGESVHYGGTVRMHADPRLGMVDEGNRLHALPTCTSSIRACSPPDPRRTRR